MEPWSDEWKSAVYEAMWDNNRERLDELGASCDCCCSEHTFSSCGARYIGDCRGQGSLTYYDIEGWKKHYGMTNEQFYPVRSDLDWEAYAKSLYPEVDAEEEWW